MNYSKTLPLVLFLFSFSAFSQSTVGELLVANANAEWHYYMDKSEGLLKKIAEQANTTDQEYLKDLKAAYEELLPLNTTNFISLATAKSCYKKARRKYNKAVRRYNKRIKKMNQ